MDQFSGGSNGQQGSEDPSQAREHVHNVEENRDALEAQARRTEATAPDSVDQPIRGLDQSQGQGQGRGQGGGMSGSGTSGASEDASAAQSHVENAERNRDALEAQSRRVESTTPDEVRDR